MNHELKANDSIVMPKQYELNFQDTWDSYDEDLDRQGIPQVKLCKIEDPTCEACQ